MKPVKSTPSAEPLLEKNEAIATFKVLPAATFLVTVSASDSAFSQVLWSRFPPLV